MDDYAVDDNNTESAVDKEQGFNDVDDDYPYDSVDDCAGGQILSQVLDIYEANKDKPIVKHVDSLNDTFAVIHRLSSLMANLTKRLLTDNEMSKLMELFTTIDIPVDCLLSVLDVAKAISREELWAIKFLDSMGRIPTGIVEGTVSHFGEYDECIEIESPLKSTSGSTIRGQYCLAKIIIPYPKRRQSDKRPNKQLSHRRYFDKLVTFVANYNLDNYLSVYKLIEILNNQRGATFRFGTCMPSACRPQDVENLINKIIYPITRLPIELMPDCYVKNERKPYDHFQVISIFILCSIIIVLIVCNVLEVFITLYKSMANKRGHKRDVTEIDANDNQRSSSADCSLTERIVLCFSLRSNIRLLFATTGAKRFVCIDAIRFLLIINVCVDHMYLFTPFLSTIAFRRILNSVITKVYYYNKYLFVRNILIIDTMFIISGLLISYGMYGKLSKTYGKFNYITYLVRLWLKYSVPMFVVLMLFWLLPLTGDGPIWNYGIDLIMPPCKDTYSLLSSFMYFSNYRIQSEHNVFDFGPGFAICNPPTWFLSALFQLQTIAPLVVLVLYKNAKCGITLTVALILFGCYSSVSPKQFFSQQSYLDPLAINSLEDMTKAFVAFHMGINQYMISFFIGILIGYFVRLNTKPTNVSPKVEYMLWFVSFSTIALVMYWYTTLHTINRSPPKSSVLLWFTFGKLFACIAISWILYSLCIGKAAFLETVFSWYGFQVVSRLSFGIYILHFLPLSYRLFSVRDTYVMTDKLMIEYITIDFIISAFIAFMFYILIERPFNNIITLLFDRKCDEDMDVIVVNNHNHNFPQINVFTANCHEIYNNKI